MEDSVRVQEYKRLQDLEKEALTLLWRQGLSDFFHVFFEIVFKILEYEIQLFLAEQYFFEPIVNKS